MARYKRKRCVCGKAIYLDQWEARLAIRDIPLHRGYMWLRPYRCPQTGKWHAGHDHKMLEAFNAPRATD